MKRRILFISRTLGPEFGGMQTQVRTLLDALGREKDVSIHVVGFKGSTLLLPLFFLRSLFISLTTTCGIVHLGDAVLSPLFPILAIFRPRLSRTVTVHGLDLVWNKRLYRIVISFSLRYAQKIVAVSSATAAAAVALGIQKQNIVIIPCGILIPTSTKRKEMTEPVLLSLGRLIPRKGIAWFLQDVFPLLLARYPAIQYVIAGAGPELSTLRSLVASLKLQHSVDVLGEIPERAKDALFQRASVLVMPNIPVFGDMEGFGITAIEAASRGLPVVASDLDGLKDSVIEGVTGLKFLPLDLQSAAIAIESALVQQWNLDEMKKAIQEKFEITHIASRYVHEVF